MSDSSVSLSIRDFALLRESSCLAFSMISDSKCRDRESGFSEGELVLRLFLKALVKVESSGSMDGRSPLSRAMSSHDGEIDAISFWRSSPAVLLAIGEGEGCMDSDRLSLSLLETPSFLSERVLVRSMLASVLPAILA